MVLSLPQYVQYAQIHLNTVTTGDTLELEQVANDLRAAGMPNEALSVFIRRVCRWGGYAGIAGRVLKRNSLELIQRQFLTALHKLDTNPNDVGAALAEITQLRHLGVSFGSKHLRFFRPDICPVFDRILAKHLESQLTIDAYQQFALHCLSTATQLEQVGEVNPVKRDLSRWYAADVEMAIFAFASGWQ